MKNNILWISILAGVIILVIIGIVSSTSHSNRRRTVIQTHQTEVLSTPHTVVTQPAVIAPVIIDNSYDPYYDDYHHRSNNRVINKTVVNKTVVNKTVINNKKQQLNKKSSYKMKSYKKSKPSYSKSKPSYSKSKPSYSKSNLKEEDNILTKVFNYYKLDTSVGN